MVKLSQKIELTIEKIVFGGEGLGYFQEFAIFVPMATIGDVVEAEVISVKKHYARALISKIIKAGKDRVEGNRISFEEFQGCDFAMAKYEAQLQYKIAMVKEVMERIGKLSSNLVLDCIASPEEKHYRNKVIEPFSKHKGKIITGFFQRRSHEVFEVEENMLNSKLGNKIIETFKQYANQEKLSVYDEKKHQGLLRNIMIRTNSSQEAMLVLIVNAKKIEESLKKILLQMPKNIPELKSIYLSLNTRKTNVVLGDKNICIWGEKTLKEELFGIHFHISPSSFFQINVPQTKHLYEKALSLIPKIENKNVVDAYSGTGTIGMLLSRKAKKVYAIEIVESASRDGEKTAKENHIDNIEFICGPVEVELDRLLEEGKNLDAIVFDPPRKGIEESILRKVAEVGIPEMVYISCNPSTLARDLKIMAECGYQVGEIQPFDMFPQTSHVETVALLSKLNTEHHLDIEIGEDELSEIDFSKDATYGEIKKYVLDKYGLKVSSLYIAQIKRKHGLIERENYNFSKKENQRVPNCPEEKEKAIEDALEHFGMI